MDEKRDERIRWCCFHPREMVVGICAVCLNEKLIILASQVEQKRKTTTALLNIFTLTSLLTRLDIKQQHHKSSSSASSSTQEDSFISIKFEDNGVASWEKGKISKMAHDEMSMTSKKMKTVKPRATTVRWRKRIGQLFQVIKWKRTSVCHVGTKLEGTKVNKYAWIRSLTKRRTKE